MPKYQTKQFTSIKPFVTPDRAELCDSFAEIEWPTTALVANDLIELCTIPAGVEVLDFSIVTDDIDSATTLAYSIGVENAGGTDLGAEVWATGITAGRGQDSFRPTSSLCMLGDSSVDRKVALKITGAPTYIGAGKKGRVLFLLKG